MAASTKDARAPKQPPEVAGRCRFCQRPCPTKSHKDCREEWVLENDPKVSRAATLARDAYRCADCGHVYPEDQLEADHHIELVDGGSNALWNRVTRCRGEGTCDCHQAKTTRSRRDRATATKKGTRMNDDKPTFPWRPFTGGTLMLGSATAVGTLLAPDMPEAGQAAGVAGALTGAWVAGHLGVHGARWRAFRRAEEAQRIYMALCDVTKDPAAARRDRFKVRAWEGTVPRDVTLKPGHLFRWEPRALDQLVTLFARAVDAPRDHVHIARTGGKVRLWVDPDAPRATVERASEPEDAEPEPDDSAVAERIRAALVPIIDPGVTVRVTRSHKDGAPADIEVRYQPGATARIADELVRVRDTVTRIYPPAEGEWALTWESGTDRLLITDRPDPLAPIVQLPPIEENVDLTEGVWIGATQGGGQWRIPLLGKAGKHWLVAGASGAGKGSIPWGIIRGLERMIAQGKVRLWIIDPKGGAEFAWAKDYAYRFAVKEEDVTRVLKEAREVMLAKAERNAADKQRKIEEVTADQPLDLVIIDEIANVVAYVDARLGRENAAHIAALCSMGRSAAFTVIAAVQDPRKETVKNRGLFTCAIALRLSEAGEVNLVLGPGVRASGATADLIPEAHPGIAYVIQDGKSGHERVRAAEVPDEEIEAINARLTARPAPEHTPPPAKVEAEPLPYDDDRQPGPLAARRLRKNDRFQFSHDPDEAILLDHPVPDDEEPTRVVLTYLYDGDFQKVIDVDQDEIVTLLTPFPASS